MIFIQTFLFVLLSQTPTPADVEFQRAVDIGKRVATIQHSLPLVNQVVLVPDEETFLDELSKWSPKARWPVLFEDDRFAPMFIRRFRPQQVLRRTSVGKTAIDFEKQSRIVVAKAWGGTTSPRESFLGAGIQPLGIVITNKDDSARIAAVALAAGRGQLLHFVEDWGDADTKWTQEQSERYMFQANRLLRDSGDDLSTITLCMQMSPSRNN